MICCIISVLCYPQFIVIGYPKFGEKSYWLVAAIEGVFAIEIICGFFLQEKNENGKQLPLIQVTQNYVRKKLLIDVITILPMGSIGAKNIHRYFNTLWFLKWLRIRYLMFIVNPKLFDPMIDWYISQKQRPYLLDKEMS